MTPLDLRARILATPVLPLHPDAPWRDPNRAPLMSSTSSGGALAAGEAGARAGGDDSVLPRRRVRPLGPLLELPVQLLPRPALAPSQQLRVEARGRARIGRLRRERHVHRGRPGARLPRRPHPRHPERVDRAQSPSLGRRPAAARLSRRRTWLNHEATKIKPTPPRDCPRRRGGLLPGELPGADSASLCDSTAEETVFYASLSHHLPRTHRSTILHIQQHV